MKTFSLFFMAILYVLAGYNHFRKPQMYKKIMPPYVPAHMPMIYISGVIEIALGLMLAASYWIVELRPWAGWGIIALLAAVFPANFYMYQLGNKTFPKIPDWALLVRLPLQLLLMAWAYWHTY